MADPTEYDSLQDGRLDAIEGILDNSAAEPAGEEISFPIVGKGVSAQQFRLLSTGMGNGIIAKGNAYYLSGHRNSDDSALLNISWNGPDDTAAIIEGFWHNLRASRRVTFPAVNKTTTYYLTITYDPLNESAPSGPVSIQVWTGEPPTSGGKSHIWLYTVKRENNQLFTDATITEYRQGICPIIRVSYKSMMPEPGDQLYGTICEVAASDQRFRVTYGTDPDKDTELWWTEIDPKPEPDPVTDWRALVAATGNADNNVGFVPRYRRDGAWVTMRGSWARSNGESFKKTASGGSGYYMGNVGLSSCRPSSSVSFVTAGNQVSDADVRVTVQSNGDVRAYPRANTWNIFLDGIQYYVGV